MKTYFVVSDIHGFYDELLRGLSNSGFELNNEDHILIVCGDIFDRGSQTMEVYNFLKDLPEERCILIKGNHEELYFDLLNKSYPESHDFSNGTVLTFCNIAGEESDVVYDLRVGYVARYGTYFDYERIEPKCQDKWNEIKKKVKESEITKWLKSKRWLNYYELGNYIFVHSFIPLIFEGERGMSESYCVYYGWTQFFKFNEDWRNASNEQWQAAAWGCPYRFFDDGLFDKEKNNGKILVCGHYRCSEFNTHYIFHTNQDDHSIYFGKNLIAIDATTALSGIVNVLVIQDGKCYDKLNGKPLRVIKNKRRKDSLIKGLEVTNSE